MNITTFQKQAFKPGDILAVNRGLYTHYGVYVGRNSVIHFAPKHGFELNPKDAYIQETTLENFHKNGIPRVDTKSTARYAPEEIAMRARACLGSNKGEYNLVFNNCEHFARWCASGIAESYQVKNAVTAAAIGTAAIAVAAITISIIDALSEKEEGA